MSLSIVSDAPRIAPRGPIERGPAAAGRQDVPASPMVGEDRVEISTQGQARSDAYQRLRSTSRILKNDEIVPGSRLHVVA